MACLLAALAMSAGAAQTAPEVALVGKDVLAFRADEATATVPIALTLALPKGMQLDQLTFTLVRVLQGNQASDAALKHFTVAPHLRMPVGAVPVLDVQVSAISNLPPGDYRLLLGVGVAGKPALKTLEVTLQRPAVQLMQLPRQTIDIQLWHGFGMGSAEAPPSILLQPLLLNQAARLWGARLDDDRYTDAEGRAVPGKLGATLEPVQAAGPWKLNLQPSGFGVGVTQGKAVLRSNDLAAPVTVDIEVRGRLVWYWVPLVVALGIWIGYLLRVQLQGRVDLAAARLAGLAEIDRLGKVFRSTEDMVFRSAVEPALAELQAVLLHDDAKAIAAPLQQAKDAVAAAAKDLNERLKGASALQRQLRTLDAGVGGLPPSLQQAIAAVPAACDAARQRLIAQDAAGADELLQPARDAAASEVQRVLPACRTAVRRLDAPVLALRPLLDPRQDASRQLPTPGSPLVAAPELVGTGDLDAVSSQLAAWRSMGVERAEVLRQWAQYLLDDGDVFDAEVAARLMPGKPNLQAQRREVQEARAAAARGLADGAEAPFGPARLDPDAAMTSQESLLQALRSQHGTLAEAPAAAYAQAMQEQRWFDAVRTLPQPAAAAQAGIELLQDDSTGQTVVPRSSAGRLQHPRSGGAEQVRAAVEDPAPTPLYVDEATLARLIEKTAGQARSAQRLQTIIVGLVLTGGASALLAQHFIGTKPELLGLFFWGFTADLSVARLLEQAKTWSAKVGT